MLALLVYCYANGIFGSRRIERATYRDIGVRYVGGELSSGPRHDLHVPAQQLQSGRGGVSAGTAAGEGTAAAACWDGERGRDEGGREREHAQQPPLRPGGGVARGSCEARSRGLLDQAEHADTDDAPDPQGLPEELSRRETLRAKLDRACAELERRAQARADSERAEYERKVAARARAYGIAQGSAHQAADGSAGGGRRRST